jgi:hypothetical protein
MARDYELRLAFSDVSATTNVAGVLNDVSPTTATTRSGVVTLVSTANQWAVGYSDSLNFTQWRNQIGDNTNLVTATATSAIPGDPIINNSTSLNQYFLRASISPIGFFGPADCGIIVQGAQDSGSGTAPTALTSWAQVSSTGSCPETCTAQAVTYTLASPAVVTPTGTCPPSGTLVIFTNVGTTGAGTIASTRVPFSVLQTSATTYTLVSALGGTTGMNASTASGTGATTLVGTNATSLTATTLTTASNQILFAETVNVGDTVVFGSLGSITGLTAGTLYYVTSVNSVGATLAATSGGATLALGGTLGTPYVGRVNFNTLNAIFPSAGSGTTVTTAVPHGLVPGQIVVPSSTLGGLTTQVSYYVLTTPTQTTFTVAATIGGTAVSISATPAPLFVGRQPKIVNVQTSMTTKPWLRMAVQQLNGSSVQDGFLAIYNADFSMGRDSAQVS